MGDESRWGRRIWGRRSRSGRGIDGLSRFGSRCRCRERGGSRRSGRKRGGGGRGWRRRSLWGRGGDATWQARGGLRDCGVQIGDRVHGNLSGFMRRLKLKCRVACRVPDVTFASPAARSFPAQLKPNSAKLLFLNAHSVLHLAPTTTHLTNTATTMSFAGLNTAQNLSFYSIPVAFVLSYVSSA